MASTCSFLNFFGAIGRCIYYYLPLHAYMYTTHIRHIQPISRYSTHTYHTSYDYIYSCIRPDRQSWSLSLSGRPAFSNRSASCWPRHGRRERDGVAIPQLWPLHCRRCVPCGHGGSGSFASWTGYDLRLCNVPLSPPPPSITTPPTYRNDQSVRPGIRDDVPRQQLSAIGSPSHHHPRLSTMPGVVLVLLAQCPGSRLGRMPCLHFPTLREREREERPWATSSHHLLLCRKAG